MKEKQEKIYYAVVNEGQSIDNSPFYEPFKGSEVPVLVLTNQIDEIVFQQINDYKGKRFVNIENSYEEVSKDVNKDAKDEDMSTPRVPEDDITPFSLWLKNELSSNVNKVSISKRLTGSPAVLFGQVSSSMRMVMQMMDQQQADQAAKNNTLEINIKHPIMIGLNELRKNDSKVAKKVARQMMDNVLMQAGIPFDMNQAVNRNNSILEEYVGFQKTRTAPKIQEAEQDVKVEFLSLIHI